MDVLRPGMVVAGHRIETVLGRGGMGIVYRATHLALERTVALKVIDPSLAHDPGFRARFRREAQAAAAIDHPNVVPVYDAGESGGRLFLSMRYIDGPDLRDVISSGGALAPRRAAAIVAMLGAALDAAHERNLLHRDVKPGNVLVDGDRVLLTDFGVTRAIGAGATLTGTGQWVGTADYMAPEQASGAALDRRADVYSLACLLYELLCGSAPFRRESALATIAAHVAEPPPRPSATTPALAPFDAVVAAGMAKSPGDRPETAGELGAAALAAAAIADGHPGAAAAALAPGATHVVDRSPRPPGNAATTPAATGDLQPARPARRRGRAVAATLAIVLAAAAGTIAAILARDGGGAAGSLAGACARPIEIGPNPFHVVVGHGSVWTSAGDEGLVRRIDPTTCAVVAEIAVGSLPGALATGRTGIWVALDGGGDVGRIDPGTNAFTVAARGVVERPRGLVARGGTIWVVGVSSNTLVGIDALTGRPVGAPVPVGREPRGIAYSRGALWISLEGEDRMAVVSAEDGRILDPTGGPIAVGNAPRGVGGAADGVWVANWVDGTVVRVDGRTAALGTPIPVGVNPSVVAVGEGSVWVTNNADATVSRIDPAAARVVSTISVGTRPRGIAVGEGAVWVVNGDAGTLSRIDPAP